MDGNMRLSKLRNRFESIVAYLEDDAKPFYGYVLTLLFVIFIRHFIESYSQPVNNFNLNEDTRLGSVMHYLFSFSMPIFALAIAISCIAKIKIEKIYRVLLASSVVILLAPVLDLILTLGPGSRMYYLDPLSGDSFWKSFFMYGGDYKGGTLGIKTEILLAYLLIFSYCRIKKCGYIRSITAVVASYFIIFAYAASPFPLKYIIELCGHKYHYSNEIMTSYFLVINFVLISISLLLYSRDNRMSAADSYSFRAITYYILTLIFGASIAFGGQSTSYSVYMEVYPKSYYSLLLEVMSLCILSFPLASAGKGYLDKLSSEEDGDANLSIYAFGIIAMSLLYSLYSSLYSFVLTSTFIGIFYLLYFNPLQLCRFVLLKHFAIGAMSLCMFVSGYLIIVGDVYSLPKIIYFIYLVLVPVCAIALNDQIFFNKKARSKSQHNKRLLLSWLVGIAYAISLFTVGFLINHLVVSIVLLLMVLMFCHRLQSNDYNRSDVLDVVNLALFMLCIYLLSTKIG